MTLMVEHLIGAHVISKVVVKADTKLLMRIIVKNHDRNLEDAVFAETDLIVLTEK